MVTTAYFVIGSYSESYARNMHNIPVHNTCIAICAMLGITDNSSMETLKSLTVIADTREVLRN